MNKLNDEPAFPQNSESWHTSVPSGMTLRDYFAIHCPEPVSSNPCKHFFIHDKARFRYEYADAMLAERSK